MDPHSLAPSAMSIPSWETLVEEELEAILRSPAFAGSRRCSEFLRFVVQRTLEGRAGELKERTVAIEVFGREPCYDPKADAVVRVNANEVRKRLAQYYRPRPSTAGVSPKVRIDLPAGGYVPTFEPLFTGSAAAVDRPGEAIVAPSHRRLLACAAAISLILGLGLVVFRAGEEADLDRFWGALLRGPKPVVVCIMPGPRVWFESLSRLRERMPTATSRRFYIPVDDRLQLGPKLLYEVEGQLQLGDALATAAISRSLGELHKPAIIRGGEEVSFADLKGRPAVLVGAFSNRWVVDLTAGLRFTFEEPLGVRDRQTGRNYMWRGDGGKVVEDYGLVSRLVDAKTGGALLAVGGLKHYGTQAAAELVTDPENLKRLVHLLPRGWQTRNQQILLRTTLVEERPGPPEIVAIHTW